MEIILPKAALIHADTEGQMDTLQDGHWRVNRPFS